MPLPPPPALRAQTEVAKHFYGQNSQCCSCRFMSLIGFALLCVSRNFVCTVGMNFDFEHEDASNLEFGKALTGNAPVLFNAEVAVLLENRRKEYEEKGLRVPEALTLTLEYCKTFGGVKPADDEGTNQYLTNLRQVLEQWEFGGSEDVPYKKSLHPFEVAALANLMTTSSDRDEACALIPSLRRTDKLGDRFTEDQIDAILENFQNVLLGLQQAPGAGGGDAIGQEMDGMGEGEEDVVDSSGIQEDDDL